MAHRLPRLVLIGAICLSLTLAGCTEIINDPSGAQSNEWALEITGLDDLHAEGLTGEGIRVAVVDTGVQIGHKEFSGLEGQVFWGDAVNGRSQPYDDAGHGTHVTGLVFSQHRTSLSGPIVKGAAPDASMIHIKAIPSSGSGNDGTVADAVDAAVSKGAHVLVLSLGSQPSVVPIGQETEDAVRRAIDKGVVVVASVGNAAEGESGENCQVKSPATLRNVIGVGAVDRDKKIATFSCKGGSTSGPLGLMQREDPNRKPEVVAPGVQIIGPWPGTSCAGRQADYCVLSGTSQAAPYVGGVVALLLQDNPELKRQGPGAVQEIKQALADSAEKRPGQANHDDRYGYGLVRADRALQALE